MAELARELNKKFKTKYSAGVVLRYVRSYRKRSSQSQDPQIAEIASKPRGTVIRLESDGPRSAYPSDISNKNWRSISATLDAFQRPKAWRASNRELVNGIRFAAITGIDLAYLPHDLPSKQEVRKAYDKWLELGIWQEINVKLGEALELPEAESETVEYEYVID